MTSSLDGKLSALAASSDGELFDFNRGIEREALRVDLQGRLAATPHPSFLGSKLCNPLITTDFSEAQLELITPVTSSLDNMMERLRDIHRFVYSGLQDELLWTSSMPCVLQGDDNVPLAQYGPSNLGTLKTTYRNGLGHRYGRSMQTISAVHYNFSFSDAFWKRLAEVEQATDSPTWRSERYFDLMRNFRRFSWLLIYLFGASPAVCNTFVEGRQHNLDRFDEGSLYARGATSLRNGDLGYQSNTQSGLINICYNSLGDYVKSLADAICTPWEDYQQMGIKKDDEYIQVSPNILQSEAEFYTTIRAKRVPPAGANFLETLLDQGVEYIEVRMLDVNPYLPLGIDEEEVNFLDTFLLYCLLETSPAHDDPLCKSVRDNVMATVYQGRERDTMLDDGTSQRSIRDWCAESLAGVGAVADALDRREVGVHSRSVSAQIAKLDDPELTPSARILADMQGESIPFFRFAM
ncbi:MAG: glutamate--cysteine ligase, partial [Pseudomonadales bacterium]|nr:glutamate--cysteine ligase [Pseudomonadales bacterium]